MTNEMSHYFEYFGYKDRWGGVASTDLPSEIKLPFTFSSFIGKGPLDVEVRGRTGFQQEAREENVLNN